MIEGTKFQLKLTNLILLLTKFSQEVKFPVENRKTALVRASMVVTYCIKLFHLGTDRHNGILMSVLLLVAETIISCSGTAV